MVRNKQTEKASVLENILFNTDIANHSSVIRGACCLDASGVQTHR
jgi:hypothetical protein